MVSTHPSHTYHSESQQRQQINAKVQIVFADIFMTLFEIQQHSRTALGWIRRRTFYALVQYRAFSTFNIQKLSFKKVNASALLVKKLR